MLHKQGEGIWKNTPYAGGKEYRKIVPIDDTFDAYSAPAMVWANESIQPIVQLPIVGLSG